ncbi:dynamin family protein [Mailhella massiliensis]|uniref:dynamin family protein n=1 Tax=Mailhella massiliensis TaxID=1903261 RepID=UPI0023551563|nr:dynamin family protein [Mailhella massiliensis]
MPEFLFESAWDLSNHPLLKESSKIKKIYLESLSLLLHSVGLSQAGEEQLRQYRRHFLDCETSQKSLTPFCISPSCQKFPFRSLLYDAARFIDDLSGLERLISLFLPASAFIPPMTYLTLTGKSSLDTFDVETGDLALQYQLNQDFKKQKLRTFVITATVSSGKSTLINALTGKKLTKTANEICTGAVCHIYAKPFEDCRIHLADSNGFDFDISEKELSSISRTEPFSVAAYFHLCSGQTERLCLIDTPGVDAVFHEKHLEMTRECLLSSQGEALLCVLDSCGLSTNATWTHLNWISKNLKKQTVIFIVNKTDKLHPEDDDLSASLDALRQDLISLGWETPTICPVSAYFSFLLKRKERGIALSEDEQDDYELLSRKFSRGQYDLTRYYDKKIKHQQTDSDFIRLSKACGIYGLEQTLLERRYEKNLDTA